MAATTRLFQTAAIASAASFLGGFVAVILIGLTSEGPSLFFETPFAIFGLLFLGLFGAAYSVIVTTLPAMLFGGLLRSLHIRHRGVWASIGALAGVGCYLVAGHFPGALGDAALTVAGAEPVRLVPAVAIAGAVAALFFRMLAELFVGFDDERETTAA